MISFKTSFKFLSEVSSAEFSSPPAIIPVAPSAASPIKFGTDGWRGIIADDFTDANVRIVAAAIGNYILENGSPGRGVCIGYDTRFGSKRFAALIAKTLAERGIPIRLCCGISPTPAVSFAVREHGLAGGIMISSSHNPAEWNGVKYKASYGGSGSPAIMAAIEAQLGKGPIVVDKSAKRATAEINAEIRQEDFLPQYVQAIAGFADLNAIARSNYRFVIDSMHGAGGSILSSLFNQHGIRNIEIRGNPDPLFGGVHPEPIEPHIRALGVAVVREKAHAGFATDGDADRIGAIDEDGQLVDAHKIFAILLRWLLERKAWSGEVVRTFNTTRMIDRICAKHGRAMHEVKIGFKNVCELMLDREILIGGEESGGIGISRHLPERDGLLNALLLANVMADEKRTLKELVADLNREFGEHHYNRMDLHLTDELKDSAIARARAGLLEIAGMRVLRSETLDGVKLFLENSAAQGKKNPAETWLLLRASGTEPLLRLYCEAPSAASVAKILKAAQQFVYAGS